MLKGWGPRNNLFRSFHNEVERVVAISMSVPIVARPSHVKIHPVLKIQIVPPNGVRILAVIVVLLVCEKPVKALKSPIGGQIFIHEESEVPLADHMGVVANTLQILGQHVVFQRHPPTALMAK